MEKFVEDVLVDVVVTVHVNGAYACEKLRRAPGLDG